MRVLVLVKQVPARGASAFVPQLNRVERVADDAIMNPLDRDALALGRALAGAFGEVVATTMGPPSARAVLEEAFAFGAQRGVHLVDVAFAGADTLATARAFAALVARERPDLVIGGRITLDGATGQVVPQLAELAGLALATEIDDAERVDDEVHVVRRAEGRREQWRVPLPAALSVAAHAPLATAPSSPPVADVGTLITELDAAGLGGDPSLYGIRGSATYVQAIETAVVRRNDRLFDPAAGLARLIELGEPAAAPTPPVAPRPRDAGEILVVLEWDGTTVLDVSFEALTAAGEVADRLGAEVVALSFAPVDDAAGAELAAAGADLVLEVRDEVDGAWSPQRCVDALCALSDERAPLAVLGQWTVAQRDWLARAAARLGVGMTGDVVGLDLAPRPGNAAVTDLVWLKPAWSGAALARVVARTVPAFGTLRAGAVVPVRRAGVARRAVVTIPAAAPGRLAARLVAESRETGTILERAARVLVAGATLDHEGLADARKLAAHLGATFAVTPGASSVAPGESVVALATHALAPHLAIAVGLESADELAPLAGARNLVSIGEPPTPTAVDLTIVASAGDLVATADTRAG